MCDYTETRVTDKLEPIPRKEPEEVTVLTVNGFVMSEAEYAEHLLSYLPNDYNITQSSFGDYEIIVPDGGTITIYWDGNTPKSYKDNVAFMTDDSETELKSIMPAIVQSLDPELYHNRKNFDKAIEDIRWYIDLGLDNEMMIVGLHTGVAVVYDGYSGMQVMFVTLKYALNG